MADKNVKVTLDADIAKFVLGLKAAGLSAENLAKSIEDAGRKGSDGYSKQLEKVTRNTEQVAKRSNLQFKALATGIAAGLPAAGAAAVGGAIASVTGAFAALGAVALKENAKVKGAFTQLGSEVKTGLAQDAKVLEGTFVNVAHTMGQTFEQLRPQLRQVFSAIGPDIEIATQGLADFAKNAMPGVVRSVKSAGPVFVGLRSMLGEVGSGVSEFFSSISSHSVAAGRGLSQLGGLVRSVLDTMGPILGHLADVWAKHGDEVVSAVSSIGKALGGLTNGAFGALATAVGGALKVLGRIADVLSPISSQIGTFAGSWLALKLAVGGINKVASPAKSVLSNLGDSVFGFRGQVEKATSKQGGFLGKLGGVAGFLGGPWGLAIGAGISLLAAFGDNSQDVADDTQTLTDALIKSKGAWDVSARSAVFGSKQYQGMKDDVDAAGISQKQFIDTLTTGGPAYDALRGKLQRIVDSGTHLEQNGQGVKRVMSAQAQAAFGLLKSMGPLEGTIEDAKRGQRQYADATDGSRTATQDAANVNRDYKATFDQLLTAEQKAAGVILNERQAVDQYEQAVLDANSALKNGKGALDSHGNALKNHLKEGTADREALTQLAQSANDEAAAMRKNGESAATVRGHMVNARKEFVRLATKMGMSKSEAEKLAKSLIAVPRKTTAELKGDEKDLKKKIADAKKKLKDPHLTKPEKAKLRAELKKLEDDLHKAQGKINALHGKTVTVTVQTVVTKPIVPGGANLPNVGSNKALDRAMAGLFGHRATGGLIRGPGSGTSDSIPTLLSNGEFVVNAAQAKKWMPLLQAINARKMADGGVVGGAAPAPSGSTPPRSAGGSKAALTPDSIDALTKSLAAMGVSTKGTDQSLTKLDKTSQTLKRGVTPVRDAMALLRTKGLDAVTKSITGQSIPSLKNLQAHGLKPTQEQFRTTATSARNQFGSVSKSVQSSAHSSNKSIDGLQVGMRGMRTSMGNTSQSARAHWSGISNTVQRNAHQANVSIDGLQSGMRSMRTSMANTADVARYQFGKVREAAANPIRAVLRGPINAGIISAWNALNRDFGFKRPVGNVPVRFATGGQVGGTGNKDTEPAMLTPGEIVIRKKYAEPYRNFLLAFNSGQGEALQAAGRPYAPQHFANGGIVADTGSGVSAAIKRGESVARRMNGKPYIWGGASWSGADCSGLQSMIYNALTGRSVPHRTFSTASFGSGAGYGFKPGLKSAYAIGNNPGVHMAGTLNGRNVEAASTPIRYGAGAHGADDSQFRVHAYLPTVGGHFVSGGGGGIDGAAEAASAFAKVAGLVSAIKSRYAGNLLAQQGAGMASRASSKAQAKAAAKIDALSAVSASMGGSPAVRRAVQAVARSYGWGSGGQWAALSQLIQHESGWNPSAHNPSSSAAGLFQKMTSVHGPVESTVAGQARWGLNYIKSAYGNPAAAWSAWQSRSPHWYDQGGWLMPGATMAFNGTRQPEAVFTQKQLDNFGSGGITVQINGNVYAKSKREFEDMVIQSLESAKAGGRLKKVTA